MRANIQFLQTNNKPLIFKQFLDIAQGIEQLWQSIMKQGILLEKLETDEIDALTQILAKLNYPDPKITKGTLRIQIADNTPVSLLSLIGVFSNSKNAFEEILWRRGFILENLTPDQAINLQSQLGKIAFATIAPDITPEPESLVNKVSGQIRWSDNTPFTDSGYVVHVFDEKPPGKLALLASVKPIPSDGSYQITYTWQPEGGRNGPNLVVQLLDPQNKKVAESHQRFAGMEEILDLIVKKTQPNAYILTGIVKNQVTGAVLPNLRVEAQFRANSAALLTLTGITDTKGVVNISFDETLFSKLPAGQQVEVIFMVSEDGQSLDTSTSIKSLLPGDQEVEIFVTIPESTNEKFIVKGTIRKADGSPLSGVVVRAFDRDLRKKELLGEQDTNVQGFFEIGYTRAQFSRMEKDQADIYLELYAPDKKTAISPVTFVSEGENALKTLQMENDNGEKVEYQIWFNAPAVATINGTVTDQRYRVLSEYERYVQELAPLMDALPFEELIDTDIAFLSAETAIDSLHISYLRTAAILNKNTEVVAQAYYGMFRQNLPTDLSYLLTREAEEWKHALQQSIDENIIPPFSESELEAIIVQLHALLPGYIAGTIENVSAPVFTNVLKLALPDANLQQLFVSEYEKYDGKNPQAFWEKLKSQPNFKGGVAESIQFTFQATALTRSNLPLVQILQQDRQQGRVKSIDDLAGWTEPEWINLFQSSGSNRPKLVPDGVPGETAAEKEKNYITLMVRLMEVSFPTKVIAARAEKDTLPGKDDLLAFLRRNPDFSFDRMPFHHYVLEQGEHVLDGVKNPDAIAAIQRMYYIAPRYDWIKPLLVNRFDSAIAISLMGKTQFVAENAQLLGGTAPAELIHRLAENRTADLTAVLSMNNAMFDLGGPWVIPSQSPVVRSGRLINAPRQTARPDWKLLFGSPTSCECEHCRSIYSPAAYLVDALNFLKRAKLFDAFNLRRPDISAIELTCTNTHTPMVFIDLINEVLENAITLDVSQDVSQWIVNVSPALLNALNLSDAGNFREIVRETTPSLVLSEQAKITVIAENEKWAIHDKNRVLTVGINSSRLQINAYPQTTWTAEELLASPEHVLKQAYDTVLAAVYPPSAAVYPPSLPFNLSLEAVRLYLKHLGTSRAAIMRLFQKDSNPSENEIAWESLGLDPNERAIIVGESLTNTNERDEEISISLQEFYGYPPDMVERVLIDTQHLSSVPELLYRADLQYTALLEILDSRFVNPGRTVVLWAPNDADCDLSKYQLRGLTLPFLDRLHRYMRLQRKMGWSIFEQDLIIQTLGESDPDQDGQKRITDGLLQKLAHFRKLLETSRLSIEEWLSLWGTINTHGEHSLYLRLFQNKKVISPVNEDFKDFALSEDLNDLKIAISTSPLQVLTDSHKSTILAALRINSVELELLSAHGINDGHLTLANLSRLYRHALLARLLRIRIVELLNFQKLITINPFVDPEKTSLFIAEVDCVKSSAFKLIQLNYLYLNDPDAAAMLEPDDKQILAVIRTLRSGLQTASDTIDTPPLAAEDQLRNELTRELDRAPEERVPNLKPAEINEAITLLRTDLTGQTEEDRRAARERYRALFGSFLGIEDAAFEPLLRNSNPSVKANYVLESLRARHLGRELSVEIQEFLPDSTDIERAVAFLIASQIDNDANREQISGFFGKFLNPEQARSRLLGDQLRSSEKLAYVLQQITIYRKRRDFVTQTLADALRLNTETTRLLLEELLDAVSRPSQKAMADFLSLAEREDVAPDPESVSVPDEIGRIYLQLHKIALLVEGFKLSAEELQYFAGSSLLDLHSLRFDQWINLRQYQQLRDSLPSRKIQLIDVFRLALSSSATIERIRDLMVEATGWSVSALAEFSSADDFRDIPSLLTLQQKIAIGRRTGVSLDNLQTWAMQIPSPEQVRQVVKAKYDDKQWLSVVRPLEDALREKRRNALVAYLIHHAEGWLPGEKIEELDKSGRKPDASLLYEHFLIDVEMSACQLTSRIRQAISAVQLFIQRCMMGLEGSTATIEVKLAREWESWRKTYRYWEANRKIFVYPENWIEPELRDDKTPFFKDLANALLQNDVTQQIVEDAFLHYLNQLNDVAKLDIVGMYVQKEPGTLDEPGVDILHVFGRTSGMPHRYYYRRRIDSRYWTAWEKVELDIEGNHLIPVVWNRRLYLFWAIFTEKAEQRESRISQGDSGAPPKRYWEIKLAFSEYRNGRWSAKSIIEECLDLSKLSGEFRNFIFKLPSEYSFKAIKDTDLNIYCFYWGVSVAKFNLSNCSLVAEIEYFPSRTEAGSFPVGSFPYNMKFKEHQFRSVSKLDHLYVTNDPPVPLLDKTPGIYELTIPSQENVFNASRFPFFYQDANRVFFVNKEIPPPDDKLVNVSSVDHLATVSEGVLNRFWDQQTVKATFESLALGAHSAGIIATSSSNSESQSQETPFLFTFISFAGIYTEEWSKRYIFRSFHHPYVCYFINQLNRYGIRGLLDPSPDGEASDLRRQSINNRFFKDAYDPNRGVVAPEYLDPVDEIDFDPDGAYSLYNWELFFHAPLLVADRLTQNQQFAEARKWLHYIFDPTVGYDSTVNQPDPARFWKIKPFYEAVSDRRTPDEMMRALSQHDKKLMDQVAQWRSDPFNPHLVARMRIRPYMKMVVMKYLDNLIAWGDYLFSQDTLETIAEATQLYVLAANILGPRPPAIPSRGKPSARTYHELEPHLDEDGFGNPLIQLENQLPAFGDPAQQSSTGLPSILYFCIPANDKLLAYWDLVDDRLFKIRHCMNIEGIVRQLPLFEPPIDPALLVRAKAQGVDLRNILSGGFSASPYRFSILLPKANELCADVRALGAALLSAYEKRDAEALSMLRSNQEIRLLDAVKEVRQKQIEESREQKNALEKTKDQVTHRRNFYRDIEFMNAWELASMTMGAYANIISMIASGLATGGTSAAAIPDITIGISGWAGSPVTIATTGGQQASNVANSGAKAYEMLAGVFNMIASLSGTMGSNQRRWDEWKLQEQLADKELLQIEKQMLAADIRCQIAEKELENHEIQRENAQEVHSYMQNKFTNEELYTWMVSEISTVYFQCYQLAYEAARRAEIAYRFERGLTDSSFVRFGQWDSLRRGLMAGERLQLDLRRLEMAYLNENRREYELTKHISLLSLNPLALIALKETGQCEILLPEVLFDLDYPGHYMRRIKTVSISIPCVTGPYSNVNCTLTLLSNKTRISHSNAGGYPENMNEEGGDTRFINDFAPMQSIATSSAQADSGLFELNFRDERYLPFEGAGAISRWRIELSGKSKTEGESIDFSQFDFSTITDVILHMRYTARNGGDLLKQKAIEALKELLESSNDGEDKIRLFSIRHEFPVEWHQLLNAESSTLNLSFNHERFPFLFNGKNIQITRFEFLLQIKRGGVYPIGNDGEISISQISAPDTTIVSLEYPISLKTDASPILGVPYAEAVIDVRNTHPSPTPWQMAVQGLTPEMKEIVGDLLIACHYVIDSDRNDL
ncbi:conserved hypothetical protein [Nitrosomonas nitrosa]|uniref:Virulence plasmid A protein n=1 Tax=Nitrosomonas nitrosa TaxID=52442 RepID=A0A8H8Z0I2_9PROT|nr:neuraminidase-like domain-containing protein [Nitrosomonas nitrosa]CAE6506463.1 conserved hypothetical protein [Nitrosomonas nitrosa]